MIVFAFLQTIEPAVRGLGFRELGNDRNPVDDQAACIDIGTQGIRILEFL